MDDVDTRFAPITSRAALDRIVQARLDRERSRLANAHATDLAAAAARAATAEAEVERLRLDVLRLGLLCEYGLPYDDLELLSASDVGQLRRQAEILRGPRYRRQS